MEKDNRVESYCVHEIQKEKNSKIPAAKQLIAEKLDAEQLLKSLAPEFIGVYILDRETDNFRDIIGPDYFREIVKKKDGKYSESMRIYRDEFVAEECRGIIDHVLDYTEIYKSLQTGKTLRFSYYKKDGSFVGLQIKQYSAHREDEPLSLWIFTEESIPEGEQAREYERQRQLAEAFTAVRHSNDELRETAHISELQHEIITAIGKIYQYISRIDIRADYYEEITGLEEFHTQEGNRTGRPSDNARLMCEKRVATEYQEDFLRFTDMSTLASRIGEGETTEFEYRLKDGNWSRMCFVVKKRDEKGNVTHVLCIIREISEIKKKEQYLKLNAERARMEAAEKSRFLSNMSHDIRTPMNGILGMIDLAESEPDNPKTQKYCWNKVKETSKYLLSLVNDVLDMNKLEADEEDVPFINFNITYMLKTGMEASEKKAFEKRIEYVPVWEKTSYEHQYLIGNPIYTSRILEIIVDNAIKFSKHGSRIEFWTREEKVDEKHSVFEFGCRDYGIGMSKDFVSHAFDMFSQENETSRTQYAGTGLGLALAKKMVDRLQGTIDIHSEKGAGTTVLVRIPFEIGHSDVIGEAVDYESISIAGLRVLIAEDNELNMEIAKFILEDNGLQVECARDGAEAVSMFQCSAEGYYDVIFMDIMMPKMNGWDAARKIRMLEREDAGKIPIIAMSANAFAEDIVSSRRAGIDLHIAKPVDNGKLVRAIRHCLTEHARLMRECEW